MTATFYQVATVIIMTSPILDTAIRDIAKARAQLNDLEARATQPELRAEWAKTALQLAQTLIVTDVAMARSILEDVRRVALARPSETVLARAWAEAVSSTVVPHLAAVDVDATASVLDSFEELARSQPREPKLIEQWASATETIIARLRVVDPARAQTLQIKLETVRAQ